MIVTIWFIIAGILFCFAIVNIFLYKKSPLEERKEIKLLIKILLGFFFVSLIIGFQKLTIALKNNITIRDVNGDETTIIQGNNNTINGEDEIYEPDDSVLDFQKISLDYLNNTDKTVNDINLINLDDILKNKNYYLEDSCATQLLITNKDSRREMQITKFSLVANKIEQDNKPIFEFYDNYAGTKFYFSVTNDGWGDASNITIKCRNDLSILNEYVEFNNNMYIPSLPSGTNINVIFFSQKKKCPTDLLDYELLSLSVTCDELEEELLVETDIILSINEDGDIVWEIAGKGSSLDIYGIYIETVKNEYTFSEEVSENIKAGEILNLPICFFPDQSCSIEFYIELEILYNGKKYNVKTDTRSIHFQVSKHIAELSTSRTDGSLIDDDFVFYEGDVYVSYPYTNRTKHTKRITSTNFFRNYLL